MHMHNFIFQEAWRGWEGERYVRTHLSLAYVNIQSLLQNSKSTG